HLLPARPLAESVRDPVRAAARPPGDQARARPVTEDVVLLAVLLLHLRGAAEDRGIPPGGALDSVVLADLPLRDHDPERAEALVLAIHDVVDAWSEELRARRELAWVDGLQPPQVLL